MIYNIDSLKYNDFSIFEENKLPKRSYFVPFSSIDEIEKTTTLTRRYSSPKVTVLSGDDWGFKYFSDISQLPKTIDTASFRLDTIKVPSTWQRTGYEPPVYLNVRYPFVVDYPVVPEKQSAAIYTKKFFVKDETKHSILTFLGVANNITLYVNGKYVGYSECSHNMSEFLLDDFVSVGENEMLVVMSKWCNGTYLECQDMFRENGIFRDVYLTRQSENFIYDYEIETKSAEKSSLKLKINLNDNIKCNGDFEIVLFKGDTKLAEERKVASSETEFELQNLDVKKWSAETPYLYDLYITFSTEDGQCDSILARVGFKTVEIIDELFLFNGQKIKFKGVNHHDTHMKNGYVMTAEELLKDVRIMKDFNCNTVRTSHYPPDPVFIELCDELGLYVVDEADIETHGTQFDETKAPYLMKANRLSNGKEWTSRYLDRVKGLYERDKNHVCVTMWSLGNESGGYKNHDVCYDFLKSRTTTPVHYEGAIRTVKGSYDVVSEMYRHIPMLKRIANGKLGSRYNGKPYFLCEYCHAMGLGPGSLEDYWQLIYSSDKLTGGCIWEFADHAFYDENAKYKLTYGGDHNEERHDGNFCVDGLFFPDRTPHSGAYEMKAVYRPIRATKVGENSYVFKNTNAFVSADVYDVTYDLLRNGNSIESGTIQLNTAPNGTQNVIIPHKSIDISADYHINFTYKKDGKLVAKEQIALYEKINTKLSFDNKSNTVSTNENEEKLTIYFGDNSAVFSKSNGVLLEYYHGSTRILGNDSGLVPSVFRAPIDNDRNKANHWKRIGFSNSKYIPTNLGEIKTKSSKGSVSVETYGDILLNEKKKFTVEMKYNFYSSGSCIVKVKLIRKSLLKSKMELPRFGISLALSGDYNKVQYYGMGDENGLGECLNDFKRHSTMGVYKADVSEMTRQYIKPQENGMHIETKSLLLQSERDNVSFEHYKAPFIFSVRDYSNEVLQKALHIEDVTKDGLIYVNIDGFMRGSGSQSCGPDVMKPYKTFIRDKLKFSFIIK